MATFTLPNGTTTTIIAESKVRARPSFRGEIYSHPEHIGSCLPSAPMGQIRVIM